MAAEPGGSESPSVPESGARGSAAYETLAETLDAAQLASRRSQDEVDAFVSAAKLRVLMRQEAYGLARYKSARRAAVLRIVLFAVDISLVLVIIASGVALALGLAHGSRGITVLASTVPGITALAGVSVSYFASRMVALRSDRRTRADWNAKSLRETIASELMIQALRTPVERAASRDRYNSDDHEPRVSGL